MKYRVLIDDRWYDVEIADLNARPVRTLVDGEVFEVWPEEAQGQKTSPPSVSKAPSRGKTQPPPEGAKQPGLTSQSNGASAGAGESPQKVLRAPIPGVIVSIAVQQEDEVSAGQELLVLEAMKMKNSIRANRAGKIAAIGVSVGQHVQHNQVLVEFAR
jgi:biotin carboxyl carrier protein